MKNKITWDMKTISNFVNDFEKHILDKNLLSSIHVNIPKTNTKLDIPSVSLPMGITCNGLCSKCQNGFGCYSLKAWRQYPSVRQAWTSNYILAKNDMPRYFKEIENYIRKNNEEFFRYHANGDMFSSEYFQQWLILAKNNPNTIFYGYTKQYSIVKPWLHVKPSNMIIHYSNKCIDKPLNINTIISMGFDGIANVSSKGTNCAAQLDKTKKCGKDCTYCMTSTNNIVFKIH